jgi:hypothetical protein
MRATVFLPELSGMQSAAPCYITICGLYLTVHIFPHYLTNGAIFGKKNVIELCMCVLLNFFRILA